MDDLKSGMIMAKYNVPLLQNNCFLYNVKSSSCSKWTIVMCISVHIDPSSNFGACINCNTDRAIFNEIEYLILINRYNCFIGSKIDTFSIILIWCMFCSYLGTKALLQLYLHSSIIERILICRFLNYLLVLNFANFSLLFRSYNCNI